MDAAELTASLPLPPVLSERATAHRTEQSNSKRSAHLKTETFHHAAVAPYQALPVAGPVITHNKATALPVIEPDASRSQEVRTAGLVWMGTF